MVKSVFKKSFRYASWNIAFILAGLNILVFILNQLYPPLRLLLILNSTMIQGYSCYWQFLTYLFMDNYSVNVILIAFGLLFFGAPLESRIGSKEFLLMFLSTGLLIGITAFVFFLIADLKTAQFFNSTGVMLATIIGFAFLMCDTKVKIFFIFPVRACVVSLIYGVILFISFMLDPSRDSTKYIHLLAIPYAFIYYYIRFGKPPGRFFAKQ